jgi:hypothetical protein
MFGKNDLVANLSRNLDRARGKRDALATDVTTLTAQIAKIEVRLSEEKNRRERDRVLGEIEELKKRIKQAAGAFTPVIGELCEASEMAAAVVPEARELNSFLLSVATEVDTVIGPLLLELDRCADAARAAHAALDLPCLASEGPTEVPKDNNDRLLRFPIWLSRKIPSSLLAHFAAICGRDTSDHPDFEVAISRSSARGLKPEKWVFPFKKPSFLGAYQGARSTGKPV